MSDHFTSLCDTLSRIAAAPSPSAVWTAVKEYAGRYGYTFLLVGEAPNGDMPLRDALNYADSRKQALVDFDKNLSYPNHPFVVRARQSHAPFSIEELKADPQFSDQTWLTYLPKVIQEGGGILVPVYRGSELWAGFTFGGEKPDTSPLARSSLQVASHAAAERIVALKDQTAPQASIVLSARETQCLSYIATGHEDEQISRLLGISPRTVRFHVDSAKTKLGVSSRVQAITKALRERIISV